MMTEQSPDTARHAGPQRAVTARDEDQDRTLRALQRLERAAGSPMNADTWSHGTLAALVALDDATDRRASKREPARQSPPRTSPVPNLDSAPAYAASGLNMRRFATSSPHCATK